MHRLVGALLYGSGLRLSECIGLRVKDISFAPPAITVRRGKGGKDRRTLLARFTEKALNRQIDRVRALHLRDVRGGGGWAPLPGALFRRSPATARTLAWQYLFPASSPKVDPATGHSGRGHLHPSSVQRAFKAAVEASGVDKRASCHTLRHSFATHALRMGYDIQVLKKLLGHKDVKTTMVYLHLADATALGLTSPLDAMMSDVSTTG